MPTPTYDLIASNVLSSTASSVTFSSISGSYRDLVLVIDSAASSGVYINLRFNSDTGANYYWLGFGNSGTTPATTRDGGATSLRIGQYTYPGSGLKTLQIVHIMDYSATDKHKATLSRGNRADLGVDALSGRWENTSAITSVTIFPGAGTLSSGGSFYLYGIVS